MKQVIMQQCPNMPHPIHLNNNQAISINGKHDRAKQRSSMKDKSLPVDVRDAVEGVSSSSDAHDSDMEHLLVTAEKMKVQKELNVLLAVSYLDRRTSYRQTCATLATRTGTI